MPLSGIERAIRDFQNRILAKERRAAGEMVRAYFRAWKRVRDKLEKLQSEYDSAVKSGEPVNQNWIYQNSRLLDLQELIGKEMQQFSVFAERRITQEQRQAIVDSLDFNHDMIILQLGPEYDVPGTLRVRSLPTRAIETMIGMNQIGSPLRRLFSSIPFAAVQEASAALIDGMILGCNPRKIAPMVRDALGVQLNRALTISRTEVLRAHREAAQRTYEANADVVKGWRWQAALSGNTCPVCISLHGKEFPLSEKMSSHPRCRCCAVPITYSWEELGKRLGVDWSGVDDAGPSFEEIAKKYKMTPYPVHFTAGTSAPAELLQIARYKARTGTGEAYFRNLKPEEQIRILGKGRWTAWKDGIIDFDGIVKDTWSQEWGAGKAIVSLKEILEPGRIQRYQKLGSEYFQIITSKAEATSTAYKIAEGVLAKYEKAEPELTTLLEKLVDEQGGKLTGLEHRLKSLDSLARKITSEASLTGASEFDVSQRIKDVSRYTALLDSSTLIESAHEIEMLLLDQGWNIKGIKNYFGSDGAYQGLHYNFEREGIWFELQFHTEQSYEIKTLNHYDYEVNRSLNVSKELWEITNKWMMNRWEGFVPPEMFETIIDFP